MLMLSRPSSRSGDMFGIEDIVDRGGEGILETEHGLGEHFANFSKTEAFAFAFGFPRTE